MLTVVTKVARAAKVASICRSLVEPEGKWSDSGLERKYQSLPELVASSCQFQFDIALPPLRLRPAPHDSSSAVAKFAPYTREEMGDEELRFTLTTALSATRDSSSSSREPVSTKRGRRRRRREGTAAGGKEKSVIERGERRERGGG